MAILSDLAAELQSLARIEGSEAITGDDVNNALVLALRTHDKFLSFETLPVEEEEPVVTLAWVKICLIRASHFSKQASVSGAAGFGKDAQGPYSKQIALSKSLMERYTDLCNRLRLDKQRIIMGTIFRRDDMYDAMTPLLESVDAPRMLLSFQGTPQVTDTSVVLQWRIDKVTDYYQLYVYMYATDSDTIYQSWNWLPTITVPQINPSATQLSIIMDYTQNVLKVVNLDRSVPTHFLVALRSRSNKYAFSNEITLGTSQQPIVAPPANLVAGNLYSWVGADANGNVMGSPGDMCVLLPSKTIQIKASGVLTNQGWE